MYAGYNRVSKQNPRETANLLSFLTFGYTFELFKKGFKEGLNESDIYEIPNNCEAKKCGTKTEETWKSSKTIFQLLWRRFGKTYLLYTSIHLTWILINSCLRPYAISRFISSFEKNQTVYSKQDAYYYGGIVMSLSLIRCFWIHNYFLLECILEIQIKSSLSALIYRKILKLNPQQIGGTNMGNLVTILTKDIRTICSNMWPMSDLVIGSIQLTVSCFLLYTRMGSISLLGISVLFLTIIIQGALSRILMKMRFKVGKMADKRLEITREALSSLKIIKMYVWEAFFQKRICNTRLKEMAVTVWSWYLGIILVNIGWLVSKMSFPILMLCYLRLGYSADTEFLFYIMGLYKDIGHVIGNITSNGFSVTAGIYASVKRVEKILTMEEFDKESTYLDGVPTLEIKQVSVGTSRNEIFKNISFKITEPGLYVFTGPLGSGKSTLLKVILKDCLGVSGSVKINGKVSYVSQEPWLFPATIKRNILFGEEFNKSRYEAVIDVCCLKYDLDNMIDGENTIVADGGLNLSRGQQARINLARGIYRASDIYLLDDPFSGLDVKVQEDIINKCLKEFLEGKIILFITNNCEHLNYAKEIFVFDKGEITSNVESKKTPFSYSHTNDADIMMKYADANALKEEIAANIYHEDKHVGGVNLTNYWKYIQYAGGFVMFGAILGFFVGSQFTESYSEKLLSKWVDYQSNKSDSILINNTLKNDQILPDQQASNTREHIFNLYLTMAGLSTGLDLIKSYLFLKYCRRASLKFHKIMCKSITNCAITFLDNHFIGNILNRFSYDLDNIDEVIPRQFMDIIKGMLSIVGVLLLILTVNWIFLFMAMLIIAIMVMLRMLYIPTGRALKRLTALTRSPLIGHINASLDGLSTIRAFQAESLLTEEYDKNQNINISSSYMETMTTRAFGFAMDTAGALLVVMVILTFLFLDTENTVGNVGLVVIQVFYLTNSFEWFIRVWVDLEQCMTSVERVVEYSEIPQENQDGKIAPAFVTCGKVQYKNVNLSYGPNCQVLKDINFTINPKEKIGIVGRTGAGKSSIISTLFRLYDYRGEILIDDVNIFTLPLQFLRTHISIIPQYPLTFHGSLRSNIDPYGRYSDKQIWDVLRKVKLVNFVSSLDTSFFDLKLSSGQEQLMCLARAFLSKNKIVVFDEPTSSLDADTDELVQQLIKQYFYDCTVITIAHRLSSILDCDKVMVVTNGYITEFENPRKLLQNKRSNFRNMMENTTFQIYDI